MKTLEQLFRDEVTGPEYDTARKAAVANLAEYLAPHLKEPDTAADWAETVMAGAEEMGDIDGNDVHGEIPRRYTKSGNPLPF